MLSRTRPAAARWRVPLIPSAITAGELAVEAALGAAMRNHRGSHPTEVQIIKLMGSAQSE